MGEEGKKQEDKKGRRFSQEQYEMLKRCSDKKDMTKWNEWRKKHPYDDILLEGGDLSGLYLEEALLNKFVKCDDEGYEFPGEVYLENADLRDANLENAALWYAHLENADLRCANLAGTELTGAKLQNADCSLSIVDSKTVIWWCKIDRSTKFEGVELNDVRIEPGIRQLLKYNVRRMNWEGWYKEHWFWRWPVQAFWAMSDYGMSTLRVVGVFFILALLFAAVYMNWAYWSPPGIVHDLSVEPAIGEAVWHYGVRFFIRPIYFSVVTMTTLGFGDMYANKGGIAGHVLLILQVILGYVLLGALVTRFAVLFTAGGPAGKFAEGKKK